MLNFPLPKCFLRLFTGVSSSTRVFVNRRSTVCPRNLRPYRTLSTVCPHQKVFLATSAENFCFYFLNLPSSSSVSTAKCFSHPCTKHLASIYDLLEGKKFLWPLFPASGEIICPAESAVKVEKSKKLYLFLSPIIFFRLLSLM